MSEQEIALTQAYLRAAGLDPVAALIRSVRDLVRARGGEPGHEPAAPVDDGPPDAAA